MGVPAVHASHILGGDLTYTALGGSQYRVKLRLYNDCSGAAATPLVLECRNGGCNAVATLTVPLVLQGSPVPALPLCPGTPGSCANPSSIYALFSFSTYEATVALPPGQWTLSTTQSARAMLSNINSGDFYTEAYLDNSGANGPNSSPQFDADDTPVQYVNWRQQTTFGFSALEPDGDSVVYELAAPLQACGVPVGYNRLSYQIGCILVTVPLCILVEPLTTSSGYFTPTYPFPVAFDTIGVCPIKTGVPRFNFNQEARSITFTPSIYYPQTSPAFGDNKYLMAATASEYRRIGGVRRLVGRIRHEMLLLVADPGPNTVPNVPVLTSQTANAGTRLINTRDTTEISVYACSFARVRVNFTDPDNLRTPSAHQLLTVTVPADINTNPQLLDSGEVGSFALAGNGTDNPVGTLFLQPSAAAAGRTVRLNVRIEDNGCPVKGRQNRVIVVKVLRRSFATILAPTGGAYPTVAPGTSLSLLGFAGRPDSVRRLATNTTLAQTYSYQWSVVGAGNGLPAASNTQNISVSPTVDTRYRLTVTPTLGFAQGSCADTASIVVRVVSAPLPAPTVTRTGATLTSSPGSGPAGATVAYQWYLNGVLLPGATGQSIAATAAGTYTVQVTSTTAGRTTASPLSAPLTFVLGTQRALPGTSLSVAPNPTSDGQISVALTGYSRPIALTVLDALGRTVRQAAIAAPNPQGSTQPLDLSALPAGVYVLRVQTQASLETRRIVRE